jgi:spore maturation protein CgeB
MISDWWEGLDEFFDPWTEVIVARETKDTIAALQQTDGELKKMAQAARDRTLEEHTATRRVLEFETLLNLAPSSRATQHPHIDMKSTLSGTGLE